MEYSHQPNSDALLLPSLSCVHSIHSYAMTETVPTESDSLLPQSGRNMNNNNNNNNPDNENRPRTNRNGRHSISFVLGRYCRPSVIFVLLGILFVVILFVSSVISEEGKTMQIKAQRTQPYWKDKHTEHQKIADNAQLWLNLMTNSSDVQHPCETTVLVVRHCEDLGGQTKYDDTTKHCSYLGFERSTYLASLFGGTSSSNTRWPLPSRLYGVLKGSNARQYETLQPLSIKANMTITMLHFPGITELSELLLPDIASGQLCHQVVVIAWKHAYIRDVAAALGCGQANQGCPRIWDDYDFDSVWELKYVLEPRKFRQDDRASVSKYTEGRAEGWMIYGSQTKQRFDPLAYSRGKYYTSSSGDNATNEKNLP